MFGRTSPAFGRAIRASGAACVAGKWRTAAAFVRAWATVLCREKPMARASGWLRFCGPELSGIFASARDGDAGRYARAPCMGRPDALDPEPLTDGRAG